MYNKRQELILDFMADNPSSKKGIILFYEQNNASYFKKLFTEQFEQAIQKYF